MAKTTKEYAIFSSLEALIAESAHKYDKEILSPELCRTPDEAYGEAIKAYKKLPLNSVRYGNMFRRLIARAHYLQKLEKDKKRTADDAIAAQVEEELTDSAARLVEEPDEGSKFTM